MFLVNSLIITLEEKTSGFLLEAATVLKWYLLIVLEMFLEGGGDSWCNACNPQMLQVPQRMTFGKRACDKQTYLFLSVAEMSTSYKNSETTSHRRKYLKTSKRIRGL